MPYSFSSLFRSFHFWLFGGLLFLSLVLSYRQNHILHYEIDKIRLEITGYFNSFSGWWTSIFHSRRQNRELVRQNAELYQKLADREQSRLEGFQVTPAEIIARHFEGHKQYVILNRGENDGIQPNDGIWAPAGVVGVVSGVSPHYAQVRLLSHPSTSLSVELKNTPYFGFTQAIENETDLISVTDMAAEAPVKPGDTIVTSGMSLIFPKGIPVGTVETVADKTGEEKILTVRLFARPETVRYVYAGGHPYRDELKELQENEN